METDKHLTWEEIQEIDAIPMNFIVAKERSGTTLLQLMLNAHPNIVAPPESRFIILLYYKFGKIDKWTETNIAELCNLLFKEGLFRNIWGIKKQELQPVLFAAKDSLTFPLICKIIFCFSSPDKTGVKAFFDKNPVYYYFLPELSKIFPEAKYIHLVRDYRANVESHKRVFSVKSWKDIDIVYRWLKVNMLIEKEKSRNPQKYFTLLYESLVSDPTLKMEEVCEFINLPYNNNMVQNHQSGMYSKFKDGNTERFRRIHQNVFSPITKARINEWEQNISAGELLKIESIAGKYSETKYGYKLVNSKDVLEKHFASSIILNLRYSIFKALYRVALANPWLYYKIKRHIWRFF